MPIDRKLLKANAKQMMRDTVPAVWLVTLIYLLATAGLSNIIDLLNPISTKINELSYLMQQASMNMDESAMVSTFYQMQALAQTPAFMATSLVSVLLALYTLVVSWGYTGYTLQVIREGSGDTGEVFSRFYMAGKIILASLLEFLFIFLWSMLFVIPGIIAAFRYAMIPYVLLDDPDCSVMEAFRRSKELMNGRKMELFMLELSFFGWVFGASLLTELAGALLPSGMIAAAAALAVSIACNLYVLPYQQLTFSQWYLQIAASDDVVQDQASNVDSFY